MPRQDNARPAGKAQIRKPHKKSRSGCANCRFRRVKCDEQKPSCRRCQAYGVPCGYTGAAIDLNSLGEQLNIDLSISKLHQIEPRSPPTFSSPSNNSLLLIRQDDRHEFIHRFQHRTALSLGSPVTGKFYAAGIPQLAMEHSYLMHTISALTLLHDRSIAGNPRSTAIEAFHLGSAAALFNERLSRIELKQNKDAVWSTAVYLCTASIFNIETRDPCQTWPLAKPSIHDLEWLKFQNGLRTLWALASTMEDSVGVFTNLDRGPEVNCVSPKVPDPGITKVPPKLVRLYNLNEDSSQENNPYHAAVVHLSNLLRVDGIQINILKFMVFAGGVTKEFRDLLHEKDPRALLLLGIWYCKILRSVWWIIPRANVECHGICIYLKRADIQDASFAEVLDILCESFFTPDFDLAAALEEDYGNTALQLGSQSPLTPLNGPISISVDVSWLD